MNIFSRIVTRPRSFLLKNSPAATLGTVGKANYRIEVTAKSEGLVKTAEEKIGARLFELLGAVSEGEGTRIKLEIVKAPKSVKNPDQGYAISVEKDEIVLSGFGETGLFYAAVSFCQLLEVENNELVLPALSILDYPDIARRGHFVESRYGSNLMTLDDWKEVVLDLVEKKQNILTVSLYGCWQIQYDMLVSEYVYYNFKQYPEVKAPVVSRYYSPTEKKWIDSTCYPPMYEQNFFGELVAFGKKYGVEVVPLLNSYGHNTLIPTVYPECSSKFPDGTPTTTGFCTNSDKTYEILFNMYDDIIENCLKPNGITSFDIGLDEIGEEYIGVNAKRPFDVLPAFCACSKCSGMAPLDRYIAHAVKLIRFLKSRGMKTVYIYNDMLYHRGQAENFVPAFIEELRKNDLLDVVCLNWWSYTDLKDKLSFGTDVMKDLPIRNTVKPMNGYYHWNVQRPSVKNSYALAQYGREVDLYGYISYTGWDKSLDRTHALQATFAWNLDGSGDIDASTMAYCEKLYPTQAEKAAKAYALLDGVNEETPSGMSTRRLTERVLSYYQYSYLTENVEYPQNYPGKAVSRLLEDRKTCERLLAKVLRDSAKAEKAFTAIAGDLLCDVRMARRCAAEAAHFRCLAEDFTALLGIYDAVKAGTADADSFLAICRTRIASRLDMMAKIESAKDCYVVPHYLRNMTIMLQFFRDLEAYLVKNPAGAATLDFTDLRSLASEQFFRLR